jgi:ubiquinone/menaquinone biosynthesis C-methylase UbiE
MSETYKKKDTAKRYDFARALPDETSALWMDKLRQIVPRQAITQVLDLGGGTGRFARLLQKTYECPVIVLDPSEEMLQQGRNRGLENVTWLGGSAEHIPLGAGSVDLVWMSQVFHHLENPSLAFQEVGRVLSPTGYLAVRNGTLENDAEIEWIGLFPGAKQIEKEKIPSQAGIVNTVCQCGFNVTKMQTVYQLFASSYAEYYEKISQRGLSLLISISDKAFNTGLLKLREWADRQPQNQPVYEPVDLFVFRKKQSFT